MNAQDNDPVRENAQGNVENTPETHMFDMYKDAFNLRGFDSTVLGNYLDNMTCEILLQQPLDGLTIDEKHRIAINLTAIARTVLAFASEINEGGFCELIARHCGIDFGSRNKKKRSSIIEKIIRGFCFARKQGVACDNKSESQKSTLANLFSRLLWLRDNHTKYEKLQKNQLYLLMGAWQTLLDSGLTQFMHHDLDNRALIQAHYSSCTDVKQYVVETILDILETTFEKGTINQRPTPTILQDPTTSQLREDNNGASRAQTRGNKRCRLDSTGAHREVDSVEQAEPPQPIKMEDPPPSIAHDRLASANARLREDLHSTKRHNADLAAKHEDWKKDAAAIKEMRKEMESMVEKVALKDELLQARNEIIGLQNGAVGYQQRVIEGLENTIQGLENTIRERQRVIDHYQLFFNVYPYM